MPRWLLTASHKSRDAAVAAPYAVRCFCGRVVRGNREASWHEVTCEGCRETLFVLPRDAYPAVSAAPPPGPGASQSAPSRGASLAGLRLRGSEFAARARAVPYRVSAGFHEFVRRTRRQVTRLRLLVLGAICILLLTVWWVWTSHAREQALLTLGRAVDRGEAALAQRDLAAAAVEFRQAAKALDVLRRRDAAARRLRQLDRECEAAMHLATASIPEMLDEAQRTRENNPSADWRDRFRTAYAERWVVLDTVIQRVPGEGGRFHIRIEYPLSVADLPVVVEADLPAFQELRWTGDSHAVVFAAPVLDCRLSSAEPKRWIVQLDGPRGFLWAHYETYHALGFLPDEFRTEAAVRELLAEQAGGPPPQKAEVH